MRVLAYLLVAAGLLVPLDAGAQTVQRGPHFELSGMVGGVTGSALGRQNADLRANGSGAAAQPFTLFTTTSRLAGAVLADGRLAVLVTRRFGVEGRLGYSRPSLKSSVTADTEGAASITVVERVDQFVIDAGVIVRLDEARVGRLVPYVTAGAGYLRQLHEGLTSIEQGHVYHLGGGLSREFVTRNHGIIRAAGLRADARMYLLSGGVSLDDGFVTQGAVSAGLTVRF